MNIKDIPVPEIYNSSADFRFFIRWFDYALTKTQYDTSNMMDLYDPLRCPKDLLWLLGDTMGYQYDDRLCAAFNRFAMLFFMSLIKYKGSKTGVTLAAEVNLKQKDINDYGEENQINYDRLEDTSIPVNSVFVDSNIEDGYIDVVYFTDEKPIDSCIEYVRPLGMYCFQYSGVKIDSTTRISVDARLANATDSMGSIGSTRVGHYTRNDYARLQKMVNEPEQKNNLADTRARAWSRSSTVPVGGIPEADAGYRALSSLQLANNEHIVKSLFSKPIFDIGYGPTVDTMADVDVNDPHYNLRYNKTIETSITPAVYTLTNDPEKVPSKALSVGIGTVTDSKEVLVLISGHNKARALAATVEGGVSQKWTCSALQMHNAAIIACDEEACGELMVDTYKYFLDIEKKERL